MHICKIEKRKKVQGEKNNNVHYMKNNSDSRETRIYIIITFHFFECFITKVYITFAWIRLSCSCESFWPVSPGSLPLSVCGSVFGHISTTSTRSVRPPCGRETQRTSTRDQPGTGAQPPGAQQPGRYAPIPWAPRLLWAFHAVTSDLSLSLYWFGQNIKHMFYVLRISWESVLGLSVCLSV